ncbi:restriction endonuclease subunit S [Micromonospora sp. NPDC006766]|uniref:restriction endonuclease subunit S n=1 Tax=Micromonospora sp. NPDC006766 TaxID=3154778 RepID=UPI0033CBE338
MTEVLGVPLPAHWTVAPLKRVTPLINRGLAPNYVDVGPIVAISQASNQDAGIDWSRTRFHGFSGDPRKLKGYLEPDDVIINSTGTGTLGRVGYFQGSPGSIPCVADSHVTVARFSSHAVHPRFGYYWMRSQPFQSFIYSALIVGATNQIELNSEKLGGAPIPLPPLEEQRRIVELLDAETARVDSLAGDRMQQHALLEERSYAEVSETLLPGALTAPSGNSPWPWLPDNSAGGPLVRLGYVCRLQNGLTVDGNRDVSGDVVSRPYLRVANVQAGYVDLTTVTEVTVPRETARRCTLRTGDVLMTEGGDLDKLGRGTVWNGELPGCLHQNHVFALRPDADRLDGDYLALMTRTVHGRCYFESTGSKTTNLASTNSSKILSFPIPLPSLSRQRELVRSASSKIDAIRRLKRELDRQIALLAERRQTLITAAVTGQIDVSTASGRGSGD